VECAHGEGNEGLSVCYGISVVLNEESSGLDLIKIKSGTNGPADMFEFVIDAEFLLVNLNLA